MLERSTLTPPNGSVELDEIDVQSDPVEGDVTEVKGRGAVSRKVKAVDARTAKRIKGRTIYLPDDLFERILVQAHRKNRTISEYVTAILERQVPDHRIARPESSENGVG